MNTPESNPQEVDQANKVNREFNPDLPKNIKPFLDFQMEMIEKFYGFTDLTTEQKANWIKDNAVHFREQLRKDPQILKKYIEGVAENDEIKREEAIHKISELIYIHA